MPKVRDWEFCQSSGCAGVQQVSGLQNTSFSRQWLRQFKGDAASMLVLRTIMLQDRAVDRFRASDDQVLDSVARLLVSGRFHVHTPAAPAAASSPAAGPETAVPFPIGERKKWRPDSRKPELADPSTFSDDLDGHLQSSALLSAAAHGVPFCPE